MSRFRVCKHIRNETIYWCGPKMKKAYKTMQEYSKTRVIDISGLESDV